jgi:hypothetical protein
MTEAFCAQQSLDVGEPLFGTAITQVARWLLLEHDGQWDREALATEGLPTSTRAHLEAFLRAHPETRFQLVRDDRVAPPPFPRRLFAVSATETRTFTRVVTLDSFTALEALDLETLFGETPPPSVTDHGPIVLVCTHGRRDPCCARLGVPVFRELAKDYARDGSGLILQTTHVGGHRFAANIVMLPHGYHYGRLDVAAARRVVRGYLQGRLTDLDRLRGKSCYPAEVQAAEFWLRQGAGRYGLGGLALKRSDEVGDQTARAARFEVTFWDGERDELHELTVLRETTSDLASPSCGDAPKPVSRHRLESYRHIHGATRG